ncbi:CRE-SPTL-3 protein [Aphelenchoides avenae]|nr:CRE-SPTL-3 protein [Aphelenchus avenae]
MAPPETNVECDSNDSGIYDPAEWTDSSSGKRKDSSEEEPTQEYGRGEYVEHPCQEGPLLTRIMVRFSNCVLLLLAFLSEWLRVKGWVGADYAKERPEMKDFAPLGNHFDALFANNIYRMISDVLNRPIVGVPGAVVTIKERISEDYGWTYK